MSSEIAVGPLSEWVDKQSLDDEPPCYPPAVSAHIARVWGSWGEYTLDPRWRAWAFKKLGVENVPIIVDLFAEV